MNEQITPQPIETEHAQGSKIIWPIVISVIVTAIVVGLTVYFWQSTINNNFPNKSAFLFVNNSQVKAYINETNAQDIGKLNYGKFLFAYHNNDLIFLDNDLFLNSYNIENKQIKRLSTSSVSPDYGDYNSGFITDGNNTLYFLRGGCAEIYSCDLYSFDLIKNQETLLQKNLSFLKHGGIGIN